jgi:hypothetical protein
MSRTADEAVVARLLAAIGGDVPLAEVVHLLAPDVICHMDRLTARGPDAWIDWVEFIRSRGAPDVRAEVERLETGADGIITAFGGLTAGPAGTLPSRGGTARYRVADGRIAEIWTSRWNYEIIFGPKVRHPLSWLLVLARMAVWRRLPRRHVPASDNRGELSDGGRNKSLRGGPSRDHPER